MIRLSVVTCLASGLLSAGSQSLPAQQSARGQLQSSFASKAPSIGAELPDASGYTADGKPFNLRELKGKYTVIVFGCLT
jgi:cytochrome oxidase Cu insertion factor (SCO1/SenC/PrrC family)